MIIYHTNELVIYETRSGSPDSDWTGKAEFIIDETSGENAALIAKIKEYAPFVTLVTDDEGKLVDALDDAEARAAWEAAHPETEQSEDDAPITWSELAAAYREGVNSIG